MAHPLQGLRARRAQAKRRRRRRQAWAVVAFCAVVVATALLASAALSPARHASVRAVAPAPAPAYRRVVSPATRRRRESVAVSRLAAYGLPLFCAGRSKRMVALTFDDGPGPYTRLAVKKLRQQHLRVTFFLVGKQIAAYPGLAQLEKPIAAFGDHTLTHPFLPALAPATMVHEIAGAKTLIAQVTSQPVVLFRPPYEGRTPAVDAEARSLGMLEVLWSVDSADSIGADYAGIERNVLAGLRPGAIILMHENHGQTIRALPTIFAALARAHLRAVTVPQLLADDPPSLSQLRAGRGGCGTSRHLGNGA